MCSHEEVMELLDAIGPSASAERMNSGAFLMFLEEVKKFGKSDFGELTLSEIREAMDATDIEYNRLYDIAWGRK